MYLPVSFFSSPSQVVGEQYTGEEKFHHESRMGINALVKTDAANSKNERTKTETRNEAKCMMAVVRDCDGRATCRLQAILERDGELARFVSTGDMLWRRECGRSSSFALPADTCLACPRPPNDTDVARWTCVSVPGVAGSKSSSLPAPSMVATSPVANSARRPSRERAIGSRCTSVGLRRTLPCIVMGALRPEISCASPKTLSSSAPVMVDVLARRRLWRFSGTF
jgi:hypothetical protein